MKATRRPLTVTNGHCADFPGSNQVIVDRAVVNHRVIFNYFADTVTAQRPVTVRRMAYATMKGLDIAIPRAGRAIRRSGT
jgi:hypothetical protein